MSMKGDPNSPSGSNKVSSPKPQPGIPDTRVPASGGNKAIPPKAQPTDQIVRAPGYQAEAPKYIAEHMVKVGETLTHISLKYYGTVEKAYWQLIYNNNKEVIGPNMELMQAGITLKIPELPHGMKNVPKPRK